MHAFHRGLSEQEAQDELESVYGPDLVNPAFTNIWFIKFNREGTPIWNNNRKNLKKQEVLRKQVGVDQKTAAQKALIFKCPVCMSMMPDAKSYRIHFESKHPKSPLPAELFRCLDNYLAIFYPLSNHTHKHKTEVLDERNEQQSSSSGSLTPASVASAAEIPQAQKPDPGNTVDATLDSTLANLEPETSTTGLHSTSSFPVDLPGINGSNGHQECGLVKLARIFPYINNSNKPENSSSSSAHTLSTSSRNSPEDASNDHSNIGLVETTVVVEQTQMKAVKTEPGYRVKRLQCGECTEVVPYASRSGHVNKCHLGNIMLHSCMICNQESAAVSRAPCSSMSKSAHPGQFS
uniref:C2H2-type domain-containing protein n=1 Tax=Ditylenchus dipsaci TaxID=166011 RepID=A0A915DVR1_9BILA